MAVNAAEYIMKLNNFVTNQEDNIPRELMKHLNDISM